MHDKVHMLLYPSMVLLAAYHQMLSYCSPTNPDSHTKSKFLASLDYSCGWQQMVLDPLSLCFDLCASQSLYW